MQTLALASTRLGSFFLIVITSQAKQIDLFSQNKLISSRKRILIQVVTKLFDHLR